MLRYLVYGVRTVALLWLDAWVLFTYWAIFHPPRSACGLIGCSLTTALYLFLLAAGIGVVAMLLDVVLQRARQLDEWTLAFMDGLLVMVFAAALNFMIEKQPGFRGWLFALLGLE